MAPQATSLVERILIVEKPIPGIVAMIEAASRLDSARYPFPVGVGQDLFDPWPGKKRWGTRRLKKIDESCPIHHKRSFLDPIDSACIFGRRRKVLHEILSNSISNM